MTEKVGNLQFLYPRSLKLLFGTVENLVLNNLWAKVLLAVLAGFGLGIALGPTTGIVPSAILSTIGSWLQLPGQLFIGMIQMIVVPLVFASIVRGLSSTSDIETLKRLSWKLSLYFVCTTFFAVTAGILVSKAINPAQYVSQKDVAAFIESAGPVATPATDANTKIEIKNVLPTLIPANPLSSLVEKDMLQIIIFAIVVGIALIAMPASQALPILGLLGSVQGVCMIVVGWAMRLAPVAVFGMTFNLAANVGIEMMIALGVYILTVIAGLLVLLIFYATIVKSVTGIGPLKFFSNAKEMMLLAFSTSSSAAVMPLTTKTAEEKFAVRPSISQFIVPLGATINMDGTALYQGVATIFLANLSGVNLDLSQQILVIVSVVFASIGSPSAPGVGIIILSTVLAGVGIPVQMVALIIGVDRILDMCRTAVNVTGDLTASIVMNKWVGGTSSSAAETDLENQLNERRRATGEDVIVQPAT